MEKQSKSGSLLVIVLVVAVVIFGGMYLTRNVGKNNRTISEGDAIATLNKYMKQIAPKNGTPKKGTVSYSEEDTTFQELPELTDSSIVVRENTSLYAELFSTSEKTGSGTDGFLREMAERFNKSGAKVNGQPVSLRLRTVSSGQQVDYVASGKYVPDGITPSSDLQVSMLNAKGVATETISQSLAMNYAGIVLSSSTYSTLVENYGEASVKTVAEATVNGDITMGYTNPFTSATGLNFLITLLDSYSSGSILSSGAVDGFVSFQNNVPFVALTTMQMRNAADKGTFDAFVSEYQAYVNDSTLANKYRFIPFGYEHTNPLAAIASALEEKKEVLRLFSAFCRDNGADLAQKDGFNTVPEGYIPMAVSYSGSDLIAAQALYKENKDADPVICVFVADVSGSMVGEPLNALKSSLINSMQYINEKNYIGLVSYHDEVTVELPIAQFDLTQQSYFKGTVESLNAGGGTATYDAVCAAVDMVLKQKETMPDAKVMIFVLSDGEANRGYSLDDITSILTGLQIPVYTVCYNDGDTAAMKALSDVNEGANINASTDDVTYQLKQLFNANM